MLTWTHKKTKTRTKRGMGKWIISRHSTFQGIWTELLPQSTFSMTYISTDSANHFDQNSIIFFVVRCLLNTLFNWQKSTTDWVGHQGESGWEWAWKLAQGAHYVTLPILKVTEDFHDWRFRRICHGPSVKWTLHQLMSKYWHGAFYTCGYMQNYWLSKKGRTLK